MQQCTRKTQPLALTTGKIGCTLCQLGIQALLLL